MTLPPINDWIHTAARVRPDAPALEDAHGVMTYAELDARVDRIADVLMGAAGAAPGVRLAVAASRSRRVVLTLWAIWRCGATAVVFDPEMRRAARTGRLEAWGLEPASGIAAPVIGVGRPGAERDHHTWVPTSGSTGVPRPVVLTRGNVAAAVKASQRRLGNGPHDAWLMVLPLFHVGGLSILWRSAAAGGRVLLHPRFDAEIAADALAEGGVTFASVVPTMMHRLLATGVRPGPGLRAVVVGGAAAAPELIAAALDAGYPVLASYGLTEACSQVATVVPGTMREALGTVGPPLDEVEVTLRGADDGGVGEIVVDGPTVSPGTGLEPPRSGPYATGDVGRFDAAGRLIVLGRRDDLIITGGENVAPVAVEAAVLAHPEVHEVVAYGLPDPEWGEVVAVSVVAATDLDLAALRGFLADRLPPAQRPRRLRLVPSLPHLPNGKVDRGAARHAHRAAQT